MTLHGCVTGFAPGASLAVMVTPMCSAGAMLVRAPRRAVFARTMFSGALITAALVRCAPFAAMRIAGRGPILTTSNSEYRFAFHMAIGRARLIRTPIASMCRAIVRPVAVRPITVRVAFSAVLLGSSAAAMAFAATTVARRAFTARRVMRLMRTALGQRQRFTANISDDFDFLLHQPLDREDFLAL